MRAWSGARARRKRYGSLSRGEIGPPCFVVGTGQTFPHLPALPACLPTCCPHAVTEANLDNLPRSPESSSQPPFVLGSSNTCTVRFNEGPVLKRNMDPPSLSLCFSKSIPSGLLFFSIFLHRGGRLVYPSFRKRKGEKSVINIVVAIGKNWLWHGGVGIESVE